MIYFDNAATTFPKPVQIKQAAMNAITIFGGNPGRSGHKISMRVAEQIYNVRNLTADFFGAKTENVIFTLNCTHSLNLAIKGIMQDGGHIITSSLEHNSVARPIYALSKKNVTFSVAEAMENDDDTVSNFEKLITPETKAIACTIASNVTGQILPYKQIGELCRKHNICFIADGCQACGILPVKLSDGINILCSAGHKGLYGTTGTGILVTDGKFSLSTIIEGGTGATSDSLEQTPFLPEMLESGTVNTVGILALGAGISYIKGYSLSKIFSHEKELCEYFISELSKISNVTIYRSKRSNYVPIVSFIIEGLSSAEISNALDEAGFALRGGFQCAALTHQYLGTLENGTVRFSPSIFNNKNEVAVLVRVIKKIAAF